MHKGIYIMLGVTAGSAGALLCVLLASKMNLFNPQSEQGIMPRSAMTFDMKLAASKDQLIDIAIIGSGCAGQAAAVYGARGKKRTLVINGKEPGGLLVKTTYVENWPGSVKELGAELINKVKQQAEHFGALYLNDVVISVDFTAWPFVLKTEEGQTLHALTVIIATGASPRLLGVPGEQEFWGGGNGVTTCAICDAPFYENKDVIVVGGGDSAIEEAMQLAPYARTVTIIVRKDAMRAAPSMRDQLSAISNVKIIYNSEVKKIIGTDVVTSVELYNNQTKETTIMPISGVFLAIGHEPNTALFKGKLKLDDNGYIKMVSRSQKTSIPGVFAAGDVEDRVYRQAGVAAGSGIKAALDAQTFLQEHGFNDDIAHLMALNYFEPPLAQKVEIRKIESLAKLQQLMDSSSIPVIVDVYRPICPSCVQMLPIVESMAHKFAGKVLFVKVDAAEAQDIAKQYHITTVPCILAFKDGKLAGRYNQMMNKKELYEFIQQVLS